MNSRHFTLVVIGDNPDEIVKPYDSSLKVEPYVKYEFAKASEYRNKYITFYEEMLKSDQLSEDEIVSIKDAIDYYNGIDDIEFYIELTDGLELDEETGNLIVDTNPNGKYDICKLGKNLSMPLITKDGKETFSDLKRNIDWSKIHLANAYTYEITWDMCVDGVEPKTDEERTIYDNMKNRTQYFSYFGDKDTYVKSSTAFWGFAVVDKENGWRELTDDVSQISWIKNFYDQFINGLSDDTRISIYECFRK